MFQAGIRQERPVDAFDCHTAHVDGAPTIGPVVTHALASGRTACIDIAADPHTPRPANA